MTDKELYGALSLVLSAIAYAPYIMALLRRRIRPHLFSWIVWSLITLIAFLAQISGNAGPGAWAAGFSVICCVFIALCSFWLGEKKVTRFDWICFAFALFAIPLWRLTDDPRLSLILVLVIDSFAYAMTARKSWHDPYSENATVYLVDTIKYGLGILAIEHYALITLLFPVYIIVVEGGLGLLILARRRTAPESP